MSAARSNMPTALTSTAEKFATRFSRAVIDEVLRAFPDALGVEQEDALP